VPTIITLKLELAIDNVATTKNLTFVAHPIAYTRYHMYVMKTLCVV